MGAMTDPDQVEKETKAKHQADDEDTTSEIAKGQGKKPAKDHTETGAAADPDRAEKETEAKHQVDDEKGKIKVHDTKGNDDRHYYLLVDPRPGEAPDNDYSTSVQCTGTGRSAAHNRDVMNNTLHSQHLKDEGVEWYREGPEYDGLHDGNCQVGDRHFPAHSNVRARGSESLSKQLRFAERQDKQEQGEDQGLYTKSRDLSQDDATTASLTTLEQQEQQDSLKGRGDPGKVSAGRVYSENKNKKMSSKAKAEHDVTGQDGDWRCPAHGFVLDLGSSQISPKERNKLQEERERMYQMLNEKDDEIQEQRGLVEKLKEQMRE